MSNDEQWQTRFGIQPAKSVMAKQRWTIRAAADQINVPYTHLRAAVNGLTVPSPVLRDRLPILLGVHVSELFTEEALSRKYDNRRGAKKGARVRMGQGWSTSFEAE